MTTKRISDLAAGGAVADADKFEVVQGGASFFVTALQIKTYTGGGGGGGGLPDPVTIPHGGTGQTTANAALNALVPAQGGNAGKNLQTDGANTSWVTPFPPTIPVSIANGGTGQVTANAALNALAPAQGGHANQFLKTDGTNTSWAAPVTFPITIAQGGTGQVTANAALNALLPAQAGNAGDVLTTDGTNTSWAAGGGGAVASVSNADGTLTVAPNVGAVVVSLNHAHANTFTAIQAASKTYGGHSWGWSGPDDADPSGLYVHGNDNDIAVKICRGTLYAMDASGPASATRATIGSATASLTGIAGRILANDGFQHAANNLGFFGAYVAQQVANLHLNDTTGGAAGVTLVPVAGTPADVPINNNFASIAARLEEIRTLLRNYGLGT